VLEEVVNVYGSVSNCLFVVFSNPDDEHSDEVDRWYTEVHGPDALLNGTFSALHRYRAVGDYEASNLALWEGSFLNLDEARDHIVPRATNLNSRGRVTADLKVLWSALHFLEPPDMDGDADSGVAAGIPGGIPVADVKTLTLVEGGDVVDDGSSVYRYGGGLVLRESGQSPDEVARRPAGGEKEGVAPHGPYRNIFAEPEGWLSGMTPFDGVWSSHWVPNGSLTLADVQGARRRRGGGRTSV
jgi:hypothetical protein